jgi:hypothetical protein
MRERKGLADARTPGYFTVVARWGHAHREAAEQRQGVHHDGDGAVGVGAFERDGGKALFLRIDAFLCDRRAKHVTKQGLASGRVARARPRRRVEREPIERRAKRLVVGEAARLEGAKSTLPLWAGGWHLARDGGGFELSAGGGVGADGAIVRFEGPTALELARHAPAHFFDSDTKTVTQVSPPPLRLPRS